MHPSQHGTIERRLHHIYNGLGVDTQEKTTKRDRREYADFAGCQILSQPRRIIETMSGLLQRAEQNAPGHVEHVDRSEQDARRRGHRVPDAEWAGHSVMNIGRGKRPQEHQELADKPVQPRQSDAGHGEHEQEEGHDGHLTGKAADLGHLARVVAFVDHANDEEQGTGAETVIDHVEQGTRQPRHLQAEHAQQTEAQVGDGGVGD